MSHDREGAAIQRIADRPACIIQFLPGISLTHPTPRQCEAAGAALGTMHRALEHYAGARANSMGHRHWREVAQATGDLDAVRSGLHEVVDEELAWLGPRWPTELPAPGLHADLFPDHVLVRGDRDSKSVVAGKSVAR